MITNAAMPAHIRRYWWALPVLSGVLLILSFHPFNLWPLGFIALAPLYYFAGGPFTRKLTFWGGFIAGGMFSFALSYFTLMQFHWLPETYLFADLVRLAVIPITLIGGSICGLALLVYRRLYSTSPFRNALLAAAVYTLAELVLQLIFGGYYLATLAYIAVPLTPLLSVAALGGAPLLSFVIAWVSGLIAECLLRIGQPGRWKPVAFSVAALMVAALPNYYYLHRPLSAHGAIHVSVLQAGFRIEGIFGTQQKGSFDWTMLPALAQAATSTSPDLLIYPFSPVEGALYRGVAPALTRQVLVASESAVGEALYHALPASTTLLTWNNLYAAGNFYNEFELWQGGAVVSEYQKRALFPFMDYTPAWAQRLGLYSTPYDESPGPQEGGLSIGGTQLGDLMCSELHNASLARAEARRGVPLIIAVGSEAMFLDDVASEFSLRAAQLRAAENNVSVVRGNILGPSGITDRFGALVAWAPAGQAGTIAAWVPLSNPRRTLYNRLGDWPVAVLIVGVLLGAYAKRRREDAAPQERI